METPNKRMTIAAVVVTFNRKALLIECLNALLNQECPLNRIYLIDNASSDGTSGLLDKEGFLANSIIEYIRLPQNMGGAGGFYEGIKLAHQAGYDWIWVMDDDAEPKSDALKKLFEDKNIDELMHYSGICGLKVGLDGKPQYAHRGNFNEKTGPARLSKNEAFIEQTIDYSSFVGLLINSNAVNDAGYPLEKFFIWYDDLEYCQRLGHYGPILYRPKSIILHKDIAPPDKRLGPFRIPSRHPYAVQWKYLCGFRNHIYLMMHHGRRGYFWASYMLLRKLLKIAVCDQNKLFLMRYFFQYWKQGIGMIPFYTIKPKEWMTLI
jgi:rhamnopyranosyl-N-acetylglucosaminyl-diphospho-decaprenol beta-1,3/1,4-galactofuranosyltransferase